MTDKKFFISLILIVVSASAGFAQFSRPAALRAVHSIPEPPYNEMLPPPIPPAWAFEPWVWEDDLNTGQAVMDLVQGYLEHDIPVGAIIIDSPWETNYNTFEFAPSLYPDAPELIDQLHDIDVKVLVWITSLINWSSVDGPDTGPASTYQYAKDQGFFVENGQLYNWWKGWGSFIDYTHPDAVEWWHDQMDKAFAAGIDGWKVDAGNRKFPAFASCYSGTISKKEYSRLFYRDFFNYTQLVLGMQGLTFCKPYDENPDDSTFVPVEYCPAGWVGDQKQTWGDDGLLNALQNLFLAAEKGYIACGSDIGGFEGASSIPKNLFIRWAQLSALCPIMENGGHGEHRPWMYDQETTDIYRYFAKLHHQLVPYLYHEAQLANTANRSIMQTQSGIWQYLLGNDLYVAAVYSDATSRSLQLPANDQWIDYWNDDRVYDGGHVLSDYSVPLSRYPLFIRKGAVIPMQVDDAETGHGGTGSSDSYTWICYPESGSHSILFWPQRTPVYLEYTLDADGITFLWQDHFKPAVLRIKYTQRPARVRIDGQDITFHQQWMTFDQSQSGWHYDNESRYLWIKAPQPSNGQIQMTIANGEPLALIALLQGPYRPETGTMSLALKETKSLPLAPYPGDPRLVSSIPDQVTDWMTLQLYEEPLSSPVAEKKLFIRNDGRLLDLNGSDRLLLVVPPGEYYIGLRHRNHLAYISPDKTTVPELTDVLDLTRPEQQAPPGYVDRRVTLADGRKALVAGDMNRDDLLDGHDYCIWHNARRSSAPSDALAPDLNLDAEINDLDFQLWKLNFLQGW
jgi:hypothetical protein